MANNDREKARGTHQEGVELLIEDLLIEGLTECPTSKVNLPVMSFKRDRVTRMDADEGIMPRDLSIRLLQDEAHVKVHHIRGSVYTSLWRSAGYQLSANEWYLQIVTGCPRGEFYRSMNWFLKEQRPLNAQYPAGIRHWKDLQMLIWKVQGII
jgi:hypothetical protein